MPNNPDVAFNPAGLVMQGYATLLNGQTAVAIAHGLPGTPQHVVIIPGGSPTSKIYVSSKDHSVINVTSDVVVTADIPIFWIARMGPG